MGDEKKGKPKNVEVEIDLDFKTGVSPDADLTVTASGIDNVDHNLKFTRDVSSADIINASTMATGIVIDPHDKMKLTESVEVFRTFISEVEFSISLSDGFKLRIKRDPKVTNKYENSRFNPQ